jgi:geranylgeranyl diphosphate synthase type II
MVLDGLQHLGIPPQPAGLYEPIRYILNLGGKRLRPILALMACEARGKDPAAAIPAAMAVELFHNFSLLHDDIMDEAPLRRGQKTVHEKWSSNTAILSGDVMLVKAYEQIAKMPSERLGDALKSFNKMAVEVCEGQQLDMDFEQRMDVQSSEYLRMIELKTAVLLGCSLELGSYCAGAEPEQADALRQFGTQMGVAFQLMDDYLDSFGDPEKFGKQVGGDIIQNKKTYLLIQALEKAESDQNQQKLLELLELPTQTADQRERKVEQVRDIYRKYAIDDICKQAIQQHHEKAIESLESSELSDEAREAFRTFASWLLNREN